jgi:hypothetical protein
LPSVALAYFAIDEQRTPKVGIFMLAVDASNPGKWADSAFLRGFPDGKYWISIPEDYS